MSDNLTNIDATPAAAPANNGVANTGEPQGSTVKPVTGATATPVATESIADNGTVTRLQQELAAKNRTLRDLGIDPDSDATAQYRAGLITREQLLGMPVTPPAVTQTQQIATEQSTDRLKAAIARAKEGRGTDEAAYADDLQVIAAELDNIKSMHRQNQAQIYANECVDATLAVLHNSEIYQNTPEELRPMADKMFLGTTDMLVSEEGSKQGNPQFFANPRGFKHFAEKNLVEFAKLLGPKTTAGGIPPASNVNPISSGQGAAPASPTRPVVNRNNWRQAAKQYATQMNTTV